MKALALLIIALMFLPAVYAACSGNCYGTVCSFTSSNCGSEVLGCVNQCSGSCSCSSITTSGPCGAMSGCTWRAAGSCEGTHNACSTYDGTSALICEGHTGCTWIDGPDTCSGTTTCSHHDGDSSGCTSAGCTYYASAECYGTCTDTCSNYYWNGDSNCYTCTERGCPSTGTQCAQGHSNCYTPPTACSSRSCSSCPIGGCDKDYGCSCTLSSQCRGVCKWDDNKDDVCGPGAECIKEDCSYANDGDFSATACYSVGGSPTGTPGERLECFCFVDCDWVAQTGSPGDCDYQADRCDTANCRVVEEANLCNNANGQCQTGGGGDNVVANCGTDQSCGASATCVTSVTSSSDSCDRSYDNWATAEDCTYERRYAECASPTVCDTDASNQYDTTTLDISPNKVAVTQSGGTAVPEADATTTTACDGSVDYWSAYQDCTYTRRYAECDGSGNCDTDASGYYYLHSTPNVPSGSVGEAQNGGTDSTPYQVGSCSFMCSSGTSDRCSAPSDPDTGFGDREWDAYACNGVGVCNNDIDDCTTNCGAGCCQDLGSSTTCRASGYTSANFWDFGTNDVSANDYCLSARVYDCQTATQCSGSGVCTYNSCLSSTGRFIVEDTAGNDMMLVDQDGKVLLRGSLFENNAVTPGGNNDFIIDNGAGIERAYVDGVTGNLYIDGSLLENQGSLTPAGNNDFIVQNSGGTPVMYIEGTNGNLLTLSVLLENVIS